MKADTNGSLQVLRKTLSGLGKGKAQLRVIRDGVGDVVPSDVFLAKTTKATILGFGVAIHAKAKKDAKHQGIEIQTRALLQEMEEDARRLLIGAMPMKIVETVIGTVDVRKIIKSSKLGKIGGCFVTSGKIHRRKTQLRLTRGGVVLWQGGISSLKRFKDEAKEVRENFECGIKLRGNNDIQVGDLLEVIEVAKIPDTLDQRVG